MLDLNLRNRHDPREHFWAARTRQFYVGLAVHIRGEASVFGNTSMCLRPAALRTLPLVPSGTVKPKPERTGA